MGKLKRAERDIGGLGGFIKTYVIEDAALFFRAEDGEVIKESYVYSLERMTCQNFLQKKNHACAISTMLLGTGTSTYELP